MRGTLGYLLAGFVLAWGVIFAYLWSLSRKAGSLQSRLEALESRIEDDGGGPGEA